MRTMDIRERLSAEDLDAVLRIAAAAAEHDHVAPLSEQTLLRLRHGGDRARNMLLRTDDAVAGYACLDRSSSREPSGELVIHPAYRGQGLGTELARALMAGAPTGIRLWAHGDLPAASRLAAAVGLTRARALWQMRRSLRTDLSPPDIPAGITIRTFVAGHDEPGWLTLNARAFARHPEQGAWTSDDLSLREQEQWFDPEGFFLAERSGRLAGFHWTKIHRQAERVPPDRELAGGQADGLRAVSERSSAQGNLGEVYVVGVDPAEQGTGLGRALTLTGLHYLKARGLPDVMLYVDADNGPAVRLYESLGFTRYGTDVMFARPGPRATDAES